MDTATWLVPVGSCHRANPQPKLAPGAVQGQGRAGVLPDQQAGSRSGCFLGGVWIQGSLGGGRSLSTEQVTGGETPLCQAHSV